MNWVVNICFMLIFVVTQMGCTTLVENSKINYLDTLRLETDDELVYVTQNIDQLNREKNIRIKLREESVCRKSQYEFTNRKLYTEKYTNPRAYQTALGGLAAIVATPLIASATCTDNSGNQTSCAALSAIFLVGGVAALGVSAVDGFRSVDTSEDIEPGRKPSPVFQEDYICEDKPISGVVIWVNDHYKHIMLNMTNEKGYITISESTVKKLARNGPTYTLYTEEFGSIGVLDVTDQNRRHCEKFNSERKVALAYNSPGHIRKLEIKLQACSNYKGPRSLLASRLEELRKEQKERQEKKALVKYLGSIDMWLDFFLYENRTHFSDVVLKCSKYKIDNNMCAFLKESLQRWDDESMLFCAAKIMGKGECMKYLSKSVPDESQRDLLCTSSLNVVNVFRKKTKREREKALKKAAGEFAKSRAISLGSKAVGDIFNMSDDDSALAAKLIKLKLCYDARMK